MTQRHIQLEGTGNFRDMGGYEAEDGRLVKWRHLYRSGNLANLTDEDVALVADLNLRLVCDFRRDEERQESPSRLPDVGGPAVLHLPMGPQRDVAPLYARLNSPDTKPEDIFDAMVNIYRGFILDHTPEFKVFMEHLTHGGHVPLMFHCAAGKDRTGFGAALIFMALGLSMETVFEDYILTNDFIVRAPGFAERFPDLQSPELFHTMMDAHPEYLQASLDEITKAYGDTDTYLLKGLGVTLDDRAALQEQLLERG
jgi:protein-tyrosine phosphatase